LSTPSNVDFGDPQEKDKYLETQMQTPVCKMVNRAKTKIYRSDGRHSLYMPSPLVNDDRFPFRVGEELIVRIEENHLIVEMVEEERKQNRSTRLPRSQRLRLQ
jgi:hypothetical protein